MPKNKSLTKEQHAELLQTLKQRFEKNKNRQKTGKVQTKGGCLCFGIGSVFQETARCF